MSAKQLHNTLMIEYPTEPGIRSDIKARIRDEREDKRVARIKKKQQLKAWAPLIHQAYKAVNTPMARVRKAQELYSSPIGYGSPYEEGFEESPSKRILDTYKAYAALVQKVADRLRGFRDRGTHTPKQMAKEDGIPNEGEHWSDWIPADIKARFVRAVAALNEEKPLPLFQRKFYAPLPEREPKPRKDKPQREHSLSRVEQLRAELREADKALMENHTPENLARRDNLILLKEEAAKEKRREYSRKYHAKIQAEREELRVWRAKQND
jgi:hypothetical protein